MNKNPIADSFDSSVPNTLTDERRPMAAFYQMVNVSDQYQRVLALAQSTVMDAMTTGKPLSNVLESVLTLGMWTGFEAGRSYVVSGSLEEMLKLEDKRPCNTNE